MIWVAILVSGAAAAMCGTISVRILVEALDPSLRPLRNTGLLLSGMCGVLALFNAAMCASWISRL